MRAALVLLLVASCTRPAPAARVEPPAVDAAPIPSAAAQPSDAAAPVAPPTASRYPREPACADPKAIAKEKRTLPPRSDWETLASASERIEVNAPPGLFTAKERADGWRLESPLKARGLGMEPTYHVFALRLRRVAKSVDAVLADTALLEGAYVDSAFPKHTEASFRRSVENGINPGFADRAVIAGKPAYVWVNGVEGYNTDYVLVHLGPSETLFVTADWNSAIMAGQPQCYQRAVIADVLESLVAR
jgi:hypothetical protein